MSDNRQPDLSQPLATDELVRRLTQKTIARELTWMAKDMSTPQRRYVTTLRSPDVKVCLWYSGIEHIAVCGVELPVDGLCIEMLRILCGLVRRVVEEHDECVDAALAALEE